MNDQSVAFVTAQSGHYSDFIASLPADTLLNAV